MNFQTLKSKYTITVTATWLSFCLASPVMAEQTLQSPATEGQEFQQQIYTGTLDRVDAEQRQLVIDDELVEVSTVIKFNGANWSWERLASELDSGKRIKFELAPGSINSTPRIIAIDSEVD
ncbi:hypothetical protein [Marinobacter sp.]|uniref:hypothetical protein n=1 Tax=Marinobacter sp. TaxID=50741 RepID=UPI002B26AA5E|nr:hypothetical protein [Marinobacter sp.]